jgi:hypothetical protein
LSAPIDTTGFILPLSTIDEVRDELASTRRQLTEMGSQRIVDLEQFLAYRTRLQRWEQRLHDQLSRMEASHVG